MNVQDALKNRKSVREFQDKQVDESIIREILDAARWAPSGTNTQPWEVHVVSGKAKADLDTALQNEFQSGVKPAMEYDYYPQQWVSPFLSRRRECGLAMYSALDIKRQDKQKRLDQWAKNYNAFGAPVVLFFTIDRILETGSYFDYGMFYQSIMLVAVELGLATCPQAALAEYPDLVRSMLNISSDKLLLCGMALGYEEKHAAVNNYRTSRIELDEFVTFVS